LTTELFSFDSHAKNEGQGLMRPDSAGPCHTDACDDAEENLGEVQPTPCNSKEGLAAGMAKATPRFWGP